MTLVYKSPFILEQTSPTYFAKDENENAPDPMKKTDRIRFFTTGKSRNLEMTQDQFLLLLQVEVMTEDRTGESEDEEDEGGKD